MPRHIPYDRAYVSSSVTPTVAMELHNKSCKIEFLKFNKKFKKFLSPKNFRSPKIFENFLKTSSLFVLNDADHFKPIIFFSIFGQLTN